MNPEDIDTWRRALARFREEKDRFFGTGHDSPVDHHKRTAFKGLEYFEPDPAMRFETKLQRHSKPESLLMLTSKGTRQLFNKVGFFDIVVNGEAVRVQAYQSAERQDPNLFVPFKDATSGGESYPASRYLDLEVEHNDEYVVDFNYAYNPYCAYSDAYVCPFPPSENWLKVRIRAGEKKYE